VTHYKKFIIVFFICSLLPSAYAGAASSLNNLPQSDVVAVPVTAQQTVVQAPAGTPGTPALPAPQIKPVPALSTDDILNVYKLAIENDPQFRGADSEQRALRESLTQAYARWKPALSGEILYGKISQKIKESDNTVYATGNSSYTSGTYTLKAIQHVFNWSMYLDVNQAKKLQKRADVDLEAAKQELMIRVAQAYFTTLASKESLAFSKAERADVEVLHERANVKNRSGIAPISDLYDAQARLATVDAQVIKAESDYRDALQSLQEMCNKGFMNLKNLPENLPMEMPVPEDVEHWVKVGLDRNLQLKIQQFNSEVAKLDVGRQKAGHYPSLDVVGRYYRQDSGGSLFGGGSVVDTMDIMLQLSVPLYEGGLVRSKTNEAIARSSVAEENVERQRRAVIRQVKATYDGIKTAKRRAEALEKSIASQSKVLEAKEQGYRSGIYTSLAVLDASRDLYLARRDYAQSRYDYVFNTLRFKQVMGTLSDDDLVLVNKWLQ
jgi:outer membrane protein